MFLCKRLTTLDIMFSRFNDVLQSAADVLAPPPTPLQDFQYHWKQVKTFYTAADNATTTANRSQASASSQTAPSDSAAVSDTSAVASTSSSSSLHKCHLDDTRIPHHLEQMLQHLIREEQQQLAAGDDDSNNAAAPNTNNIPTNTATTTISALRQPCLDFLLATRPLDLLAELAATDAPPGARVCILAWLRRYLSCMRRPRLDRAAVLQPVQRLIALCRGGRASPYETEEILFAATVAGLVRKEPFLVHLFLPAHQHSAFVRRRLQQKSGGGGGVGGNGSEGQPRDNRLFDAMAAGVVRKMPAIVADVQPASDEPDTAAATTSQAQGPDVQATTTTVECFACDCDPHEDRLTLLDTILGYTDSPDTLVILRACEGALMLATLPTVAATRCAAVHASLAVFADRVATRLGQLCSRIPEDMDPGDIEDCTVSWGLQPHGEARDRSEHFVGRAQLQEFLGWLDYTNCLAQEACDEMSAELGRLVRARLLCDVIEPALLDEHAGFVLVLLAKIVHQLDARQFTAELAHWLVGPPDEGPAAADGELVEEGRRGVGGGGGAAHDCLLNIIVDMAQDNGDLLLPTLQFVEALIDNCNERILHGMLFRYVCTRGYYDAAAAGEMVQTWSDEEEERARRRTSDAAPCRSRTMAPTYILKVINNFLLLLPRQIMSAEATGTCYEEYVQDASRHYQNWVLRTVDFGWPSEASFPPDAACCVEVTGDVATTSGQQPAARPPPPPPPQAPGSAASSSNSSGGGGGGGGTQLHCNDSGICEETFYEGPLLRLLFQHVRNMATHPYEFNLAVIAILSKLALLPHPFLHEILLDPEVPVARGTHTLWSSMQWLARQLLLEVPRREGFQRKVAETGRRLLTNPPMLCESSEDCDPVFEALVVLEEFCKELAAIAFVKYHHATE